MTDDRPNLFQFATSELSQDAFICWLLSWADARHKVADESLHLAGTTFLDALLRCSGIEPPAQYDRVKLDRQFEKLDVLALVNDDLAVLIEDKTDTNQHSGQLVRYREAVKNKYPQRKLAAIYYKTGDQGNYQAIKDAEFFRFKRQDMLGVLQRGRDLGVTNAIFADYHNHLQRLDDAVRAFRSLPLSQWGQRAWIGFFIELQAQLGVGDWKKVNNEEGGFMGFWWHGTGNKYLLLKEKTLCFKLHVAEPDKERRRASWKEWHAALVAEAHFQGWELKKLKRALGKDMTVAYLPGDYRKTDDQDRLDLDRTVMDLRKAERFHDAAMSRLQLGGLTATSQPPG